MAFPFLSPEDCCKHFVFKVCDLYPSWRELCTVMRLKALNWRLPQSWLSKLLICSENIPASCHLNLTSIKGKRIVVCWITWIFACVSHCPKSCIIPEHPRCSQPRLLVQIPWTVVAGQTGYVDVPTCTYHEWLVNHCLSMGYGVLYIS